MRQPIRVLVLLAVLSSFYLGCKKDDRSVSIPKGGAVRDTDTVVEVSGERLTVTDLEDFADIRLRLMDKSQHQSKQDLVKARNRLIRIRYSTFPGTRLLVREAKRRGLHYQSADYAHNIARLSKLPAKLKSTISTLIDEDLFIDALRKDILRQTPAPDDAFLAERLKVLASHNARAEKTNELSRTFLAKLKQEIENGEIEFEEAARQHSEDEWLVETGSEWGTFSLADLAEDVEVYDTLKGMKPGDLAGPLRGDNGLMLLRLDAVANDKYRLSRIFRRLMALYEEETVEQMRMRFQREDCEEKLKMLAKRLLKEAPPTYPNGTNFIEKVLNQTTTK